MKVLVYLAGFVVIMHGIAHLAGVKLLWPVGEGTYPLAGGRWQAGPAVRRFLAVLWTVAAAGFIGSAIGWLAGTAWWWPVTVCTALLSSVLVLLDWKQAFRGAIVNIVIFLGLALAYSA